ncbi:MAG: SDR family NAD(P)-dependent oxidoreductase, partial [Ketobacteraceae bacterium]|nr:SDR family NAD(P)-dependent oxidoreductase [Ketobacteraceae bacterium]
MPNNLFSNPQFMEQHGLFLVRHTGNDKDFLTTRASYCFNLTGPSVNVQTACSSSLVAMHGAIQSLMSHECDMALAGGVTIELPHRRGYLFQEGEILSPDGHCRAFDAASKGTVFGSGVGVIAMKRLEDALDDGDTIHAVIKASAVNNDGSGKVSYMAPSVDGQAAAVHEALTVADINPETIGYVECHGTGTPIGDPIEITALTMAYRQETGKKQFCRVGSVKSNIGHLDTAAGVAAMIKVVQSLKHRQIPPSINFSAPNPAIDWDSSPFSVNAELRDWESDQGPRRAGVSSLGVGGTNAHIIVEEAPEADPGGEPRPNLLFVLSARSKAALDAQVSRLTETLQARSAVSHDELADIAYTLQVGRKAFEQRLSFSAGSVQEAIDILSVPGNERVARLPAPEKQRKVAFMMAGGGAQYPNMGLDLYNEEPVYREAVDECLSLISEYIDFDLREVMFPPAGSEDAAAEELQQPSRSVTSLFITQYAQARLWQSWGIEPAAMIGHSLGENTAACLAGVFSLKDALGLVALRGRLFEKVPAGGMLSVQLPESDLRPRLGDHLDVAAVNAGELTVLSGPVAALDALQQTLEKQDVECQRVRIHIAAHSRMLEPVLEEFRSYLQSIRLQQPEVRILSNLTGDWLCPVKASTADYWVDHLRNTVRFGEGVDRLLKDNQFILLEVGPGRTLSSLARMGSGYSPKHLVVQSMRSHSDERNDQAFMLDALGRLWCGNASLDWKTFYGDEFRHRVPLPTYPFEHKKYWMDPGDAAGGASYGVRREDLHEWAYQPVWEPAATCAVTPAEGTVFVVIGDDGLLDQLESPLADSHSRVIRVRPSEGYRKDEPAGQWHLNLTVDDHWSALFADTGLLSGPAHLVFGASLAIESSLDSATTHGLLPLLALGKALAGEELKKPCQLTLLTRGALACCGDTVTEPLAAMLSGPAAVMPSEISGLVTRLVDLDTRTSAEHLLAELDTRRHSGAVIAQHGKRFYQRHLRPYQAPQPHGNALLESGDTVLISGGLGGLGLEMADALSDVPGIRLVLVNRRAFPGEEHWQKLASEAGAVGHKARALLALQQKGCEVLVAAADIADEAGLASLKGEIIARFGRLDALVHTAGVIDDSLMAMKEPDAMARVLAPKVSGTRNLLRVFADQSLKRVVLFSSSSSYSGLAGQFDYAAANAYLDAVAQDSYAAGQDHVVAINWPAWKESGMAARMATQQLDTMGGQPAAHPWMGTVIEGDENTTAFIRTFSVANDWVLGEHRIRDAGCLLPGTSYLELGRAAFNEKNGEGPVTLTNVVFLTPCFVGDDEEITVRTQLVQAGGSGNDAAEFSVASYRQGDWVEHARGNVSRGTGADETIDPAPWRKACPVEKPVPAGGTDQFNLIFGERWHCTRHIAIGDRQALLDLAIKPDYEKDLEWAHLHPALLDIATAGAQRIVPHYDAGKDFLVPLGYSELAVYAPLQPQLLSHIRLHDAGDDTVTFHVTVTDTRGKVLVKVNDFTMKRVPLDFS